MWPSLPAALSFRVRGDLAKRRHRHGEAEQGHNPNLPAWGTFRSRDSSLRVAGMVESGFGDAADKQIGVRKCAKIISLPQLKPCPLPAVGCRGPGDGVEP